MNKIAVIGIGNVLLRDDGVGVHAVDALRKKNLLEGVELIDGGTSTFDLIGPFSQNSEIIIVDSLKGGYPPGTIYKLSPEELGAVIKNTSSLHDVQVLDILRQAHMMGHHPRVKIIGVEPYEIFFDMEMSDVIEGEFDTLLKIICEEVSQIREKWNA